MSDSFANINFCGEYLAILNIIMEYTKLSPDQNVCDSYFRELSNDEEEGA